MSRFMSIATPGLILAAGLAVSAGSPAVAAEPGAAAAAAERERRVVSFVEEHQPELARLLTNLAERKPADYARALEELDRSVQPLTTGRAKDPRLHEMELQAWQARTRVELLGARCMAAKKVSVSEREALERQLRDAIIAELDIRAAQLAYRKQRSTAWYDRQINRLATKRDDLVNARLKSLLD